MPTRNISLGTGLLLLFLSISLPHTAHSKTKLQLWVHPYIPATEIIKKFSPLADYLSEKSGKTVQIKVSKSYKSHIERVGEGGMDLAYLGPVPYVKVTETYGRQELLACLEVDNKPFFHSVIIARKDSPIKKVRDLKGKKFAFGNPNSTMSHLLPRYILNGTGIPVKKLKEYGFLDSHHNVALGVLGGYYDAGGVKEDVYLEYRDRGLKMLAKSAPITEHLFIANKDLPEETIETMRRLLLSLKDRDILTSIKNSVTGMVNVEDEDYDTLRLILNRIDKSEPIKR